MIYTLLEATQLILSSMDSDAVNSINDTIESQQVALLLKSVYYDCASDIGLNENSGIIQLNASGDSGLPVYMSLPQEVTKLIDIRYDTYDPSVDSIATSNYKLLEPVDFDVFLEGQTQLRQLTSGVAEMTFDFNGSSFNIMYYTGSMPTMYTTLNNKIVLFDGFDSSIESTLQRTKTLCKALTYPSFEMEDAFIPNLDPTQFSYYLNKAKVRAFAELKQTQNAEAGGEARRQKIIIQKRKERTPERSAIERAPKYGRR